MAQNESLSPFTLDRRANKSDLQQKQTSTTLVEFLV